MTLLKQSIALTMTGIFLSTAASMADVAQLAGWNQHNSSTMSYPYEAPTKDALVSSATWTPFGLTPLDDTRTYFNNFDYGDYFEFALQLTGGVAFDKFYQCGASANMQQLELRSSADGYATALGGYTLNGAWNTYEIDISSLSSVSDNITFRLYGTGNTGPSSIDIGFSNGNASGNDYPAIMGNSAVAFTGSAIPEPATLGLMVLFGGGIFAVRRIFMI